MESSNILRTAVLGLDAMSWDYLNKLFRNGVVPNISKYFLRSVKGSILAIPPITPPSWASIMTGVNPGKHGIFGFFKYVKTGNKWEQRLITANDLKYPRLHEKLSLLGIKTFIMNPIPDYPLIPVPKATIISNMFFTPRPLSYPSEALIKYFGGRKDYVKEISSTGCKLISDYVSVVEDYLSAVEKAINEDYKLLWINLIIPDRIFHECPKILVSNAVSINEKKLFELVDKLAKVLRENSDNFIIISDHGFSKYTNLVSVNDILVKEGFARTAEYRPFRNFSEFDEKAKNKERATIRIDPYILELLEKLRVKSIARFFVRNFLESLLNKRIILSYKRWPDITASQAFMPDKDSFGIYLNNHQLKGEIIDVLVKKYNKFIDVYEREKIYWGIHVSGAPDLVIIPNYNEGYWIYRPEIVGKIIVRSNNFFYHHPYGVFVLDSDDPDILKRTDIGVLKNYVAGNIISCATGAPMDKSRDTDIEIERKVCQKNSNEFNYLTRWAIGSRIIRSYAR